MVSASGIPTPLEMLDVSKPNTATYLHTQTDLLLPGKPNFFEGIFCSRYINAADNLLTLLQASNSQYDKLKADYSSLITGDCSAKLAASQAAYDSLKATADSQQQLIIALKDNSDNDLAGLPAATQTLAQQYWTKYPPAAVTYPGRDLPNAPGNAAIPQQNYEMRVENWAAYGINSPEAREIIDKNGFSVLNVMEKEGVPMHRSCDIATARIKVWVTKAGYIYNSDTATAQNSEYWKFFIETLKSLFLKIGSDCEDWAILIYVLCRTAGIPKHLLRISAGITRDSQGHCTNHYLASDLKWHHVNSTTPYGLDSFDVLTTPLIGDATDQIGLASVWFSFTEDAAWSGGVPTLTARPADYGGATTHAYVATDPSGLGASRIVGINLSKCKLLRNAKVRPTGWTDYTLSQATHLLPKSEVV